MFVCLSFIHFSWFSEYLLGPSGQKPLATLQHVSQSQTGAQESPRGYLGQAAPQLTLLSACTVLNQPHEVSPMHRPTACVLPNISKYQSKMQRITVQGTCSTSDDPAWKYQTSTMHLLCICLQNHEQKYGSPRGEFAANVLLKPTLGLFLVSSNP